MGVSLRIMSLPFILTSWTRTVGRIITTDHNVPSLGRMLYVCSSMFFKNGTIKFNFGLLVSFHIANLRLEISGNEVTPGENRENLDPVKFPMYTCMYVYLQLPSFLPPYKCTFTNSHQLIVLVDGLWYLGFGTQTARSLSSGAILIRIHCRVVFNFSSIWTERGWECEKGGCVRVKRECEKGGCVRVKRECEKGVRVKRECEKRRCEGKKRVRREGDGEEGV